MKFKLEVFPGDFGLPSLDFDCLRTILFCRMARINVEIVPQANITFHNVPCLKDSASGQILAKSFHSVTDYFRENPYHFSANGNKASSNIIADMYLTGADQFVDSMKQNLRPAFLQVWWRDEEHYNEFLRAWFAGQLPFPTNFFWPRRLRSKASDEFLSLVPVNIDQNNVHKIEKQVLDKAENYIRALSKHISKSSPYLLGEKPTIADVDLLSYLLLFHKVPTKNQQIKNIIKELEPVLKYVEKTAQPFIADAPGVNSSDPYGTRLEESMKLKPKDLIFSGAFAVVAMIFFAVTHGILNVSDEKKMPGNRRAEQDDDDGHDEFEE